MWDLYDSNNDDHITWTEAWSYFQFKEKFETPTEEIEPTPPSTTEIVITEGMNDYLFKEACANIFRRTDVTQD
jgi:hypothetical protein